MIIVVNVTSCVSQQTLIQSHWLKEKLSDVFHVLTQTRYLGGMACKAVFWKCVLISSVLFSPAFFSVALEYSFCSTFLENVYHYDDPLKKLVLDNNVTSDQWHSHQSLFSAWRDSFAISWQRLWPIAQTPLHFAYRAGRGVEDAILTLFNLISGHLDTSGTTVRVLFTDLFYQLSI